ncbi:MAG: thiolase family protein [Planctomycetota bacterium]|nr:thiolase family protein [Planctomycetota bacterium]
MSETVILSAVRSPIGRFLGGFSNTTATDLGAKVAQSALEGIDPSVVDEALMGCVLQAGLGQNPARQIALGAGCPDHVTAMTINKVCGSGLEAAMQADRAIRCQDARVVLCGGAENMTRAPHTGLIRPGAKFGPATFADHMQADGLTCAFKGWAMGNAAEWISNEHNISREDQDAFAARSHQKAAAAAAAGHFDAETRVFTGAEIGNRKVPGPEGGVGADEGVRADSSAEGLAKLRPAFDLEGSVTAGNASQISDGAAALVVASSDAAEELGVKPLAKIVGHGTAGVSPEAIFTAPAAGVAALLDRHSLTADDIDLFEINEAFAAQVLMNQRALGISDEKLNISGGGIALGHPIGASGARVLVTLIHGLIRTGGTRGVASLCLGGGNAVSMLVERAD